MFYLKSTSRNNEGEGTVVALGSAAGIISGVIHSSSLRETEACVCRCIMQTHTHTQRHIPVVTAEIISTVHPLPSQIARKCICNDQVQTFNGKLIPSLTADPLKLRGMHLQVPLQPVRVETVICIDNVNIQPGFDLNFQAGFCEL